MSSRNQFAFNGMPQLKESSCATPPCRCSILRAAKLVLVLAICGLIARASDHSDAPRAGTVVREDANLTDLHAFVSGENLVISICANPAIPRSATGYVFPTDVTFDINLDLDSPVSPDDPSGMGGTILDPQHIREDVVYRVRFNDDGSPRLQVFVNGPNKDAFEPVSFFAGLRDDPFIRGPRIGRNISAIVLEVPLAAVTQVQSTLLLWATTKVEDFDSPFQDLVGRSLRSMMPENNDMNRMHPREQAARMGVPPDVMIYNTALPAQFPNGRALQDDVVTLVGDPRVLANDAPFPDANDVPFLTTFPYLAPPQPPPVP